jgi:hypothetical protein
MHATYEIVTPLTIPLLYNLYNEILSTARSKVVVSKLSEMSTTASKPVARIGIIGVGQVGGAAAFALILASVASELLLVDTDANLRDGQVRDLSDVAYSCNSTTRVQAATHHEAGQCDIVVITAGSRCMLGKRLHYKPQTPQTVADGMCLPYSKDKPGSSECTAIFRLQET